MRIARIMMTEQNTPETQERLLDNHREEVRTGFLANADFSVAIKLGDTSYMLLPCTRRLKLLMPTSTLE